MLDEKHSKSRWKIVLIIIACTIVLLIIGYGAYKIISMNNTIAQLNEKVRAHEVTLYSSAKETPKPTEDYLDEITEVTILYNQKAALVKKYYDMASDLVCQHKKEEGFSDIYSIASADISKAQLLYDLKDGLSEKYNYDSTTFYYAALAGLYYSNADAYNQILIEADGLIKLLKDKFSNENYAKVKAVLNEIKELKL